MHLSTHPTSYPTRYQEIAAKLEQELRQHYRCGDYLPAEQQLAARFEVNRHTLRRAIDQLVEKGWVQRRQGVGVLVLMRPFDYPLHTQARFSQNLLDQGSHPTSEKLLSVLRPASGHVADALGITEGENVIHLRTLRRFNVYPWAYGPGLHFAAYYSYGTNKGDLFTYSVDGLSNFGLRVGIAF